MDIITEIYEDDEVIDTNKNLNNSSDDHVAYNTSQPYVYTMNRELIYIYVLASILFSLICLVGNSLVVYFYTQSGNAYTCKAYVLALALIDVVACVALCVSLILMVLGSTVAFVKLVLQPAVRALRAVYGQILKKSYGTRTLHARHTYGFLPVYYMLEIEI